MVLARSAASTSGSIDDHLQHVFYFVHKLVVGTVDDHL
jgi:hypothetical protein